jgi:TatD DNase family protein
MFIDSHCHLELEEYDQDRDRVIARACEEGISQMLTVGTEVRYFAKVIEIVETYPTVYGAIGVHPHNAEAYSDEIEDLIKRFLSHPKIVGYGEIGLDFYRDYSPRRMQMEAFRRQIGVARTAGLPVIIHSRNAREETLGVLKEARLDGYKTIIHCYSYDLETARKFLDMGMYLSIPGTITYKNSGLAEVVRSAPLERLLSETDAPFLAPLPHRGKRNEPAYVRIVVEEIARIKGITVQEASAVLAGNFAGLFLTAPRETL